MDSEDRSTQKDTSSSAVTSSLSDLIARLEKAVEGSRDLDVDICLQISDYSQQEYRRWLGLQPKGTTHTERDFLHARLSTRYTSSIDAAMSLVPEGHDFLLSGIAGDFNAEVGPENSFQTNQAQHVPATPAIALCIAALRARSQIESLPANDSAETRLEI